MHAKLIEWTELAPGVRNFVFEAVFEAMDAAKFEFIPGQFVSFSDTVNGKVITRAYSIASAPSDGNRFELCLNIVDDGAFTPHLFSLAPGAVIQMPPPLGTFTLPTPRRDALLIATGTGVAPFRSMLKTYLAAGSPAYTLLFGVRYESHLLYRTEFEEMARSHAHFSFWPTLTQPGPEWTGRSGRVQAHLEEALGGRRDVDVMLCGLKPMVDDMRRILKETGFDRKQIRYEKYD
jgi:CDP-4-dehydro-6-deoxyglucose reductase